MAVQTRSARPAPANTSDPGQSIRTAQKAIFRKEGEYWTVGYGGKSFSLKDTKGLGYLAHLLRHPAAEFHVLDLVGGIAGQHDDDETIGSAHGLPRGEEDLKNVLLALFPTNVKVCKFLCNYSKIANNIAHLPPPSF